ncbi:MAG: hypothetical protein Q4A62_08860 [Eikenella sp.]|nr:hypothetical protein [Eikenella sp.]
MTSGTPHREAPKVLFIIGTIPKLQSGQPNFYFAARTDLIFYQLKIIR